MEQEKMIEEMTNDIHNAKKLSDYHCYEDEYTDCKKCKLLKYAENKMCQDAYEACFLIEEGYRKIPEGAVVLTKAEYEKLKLLPEKVHEEMTERLKAEVAIEKRMGEKKAEQACQEITKKLLRKVLKEYDELHEDFLGCKISLFDFASYVRTMIISIAQQQGVEVE